VSEGGRGIANAWAVGTSNGRDHGTIWTKPVTGTDPTATCGRLRPPRGDTVSAPRGTTTDTDRGDAKPVGGAHGGAVEDGVQHTEGPGGNCWVPQLRDPLHHLRRSQGRADGPFGRPGAPGRWRCGGNPTPCVWEGKNLVQSSRPPFIPGSRVGTGPLRPRADGAWEIRHADCLPLPPEGMPTHTAGQRGRRRDLLEVPRDGLQGALGIGLHPHGAPGVQHQHPRSPPPGDDAGPGAGAGAGAGAHRRRVRRHQGATARGPPSGPGGGRGPVAVSRAPEESEDTVPPPPQPPSASNW